MIPRRAVVSLHGTRVGQLTDVGWRGSGSCEACGRPAGNDEAHGATRGPSLRFEYDADWLEREDAVPVSLALPLRRAVHEGAVVGSVFENLLPEGWMREAMAGGLRLSPDDVFGLVSAVGRNLVGAIEVGGDADSTRQPRDADAKGATDENRRNTGHGGLDSRRRRRAGDVPAPGASDRGAGRGVGVGFARLADVRCQFNLRDARGAAIDLAGDAPLPGVQRKLAVSLFGPPRAPVAVPGCGRHILKPQASSPNLPENEWLTMRLAAAAGVDIAPCALISLADGSPALIVERFDRPGGGGKLRTEDFCQLAGKLPREKHDADAERCAAILQEHATEPLIEVAKLFRRFVVAWWTANTSLHLKDLSLVTSKEGVTRLSPAYDLQCTALLAPDAGLALPIFGKRHDVRREDWLNLADACALRRPAAERVLHDVHAALAVALKLVAMSPLPDDAKRQYAALLQERTRQLAS